MNVITSRKRTLHIFAEGFFRAFDFGWLAGERPRMRRPMTPQEHMLAAQIAMSRAGKQAMRNFEPELRAIENGKD